MGSVNEYKLCSAQFYEKLPACFIENLIKSQLNLQEEVDHHSEHLIDGVYSFQCLQGEQASFCWGSWKAVAKTHHRITNSLNRALEAALGPYLLSSNASKVLAVSRFGLLSLVTG